MILTGPGIESERAKGTIVLEPFNPLHLNPNSYDLTLGLQLLCYERVELRAGTSNATAPPFVIPPDGFRLLPNRIYLAASVEYTETHPPWVPQLNGKSSLGRLGLLVHATAGFGDMGFRGRWTLELSVIQPLLILPNIRIAQLAYFRGEGPVNLYSGRYQDQQRPTPYIP